MASFAPLKDSLLLSIDEAMRRLPIEGPFLDVGCGTGDVSAHMAWRGMTGTAMDVSEAAIDASRAALVGLPVRVLHGTPDYGPRIYGCVLFMDVLEHVHADVDLIERGASCLVDGGHMLISVPSNPREWRWDDDFYGHVRRYTVDELREKLRAQGLTTRLVWDFTFPTFWLMRRAYTRLKPQPAQPADEMERTLASAVSPGAHHIPLISGLLAATTWMWKPLLWAQFRLFRHQVERGHEMFVVAQRSAT
jgi:SAM-dependent methyltransferase